MSHEIGNFDIVVVGGGFGGLQTAITAAEKGHSVLVFDKEHEIGYPVRTSGASYVDEMEKFHIPNNLYYRLRRCLFASANDVAEFKDPKSRVCILNVRGVLQHLAEQAAKNGAVILLSTTANKVLLEDGKVTGCYATRFSKQYVSRSKILIDASGFSYFISSQRLEGDATKWKRFGLGAEYEAYVENLEDDTAMLLVGSEVAPTGYAWVFPVGKNRARIGVGVTKTDTSASPVEFLDQMLVKRPKIMSSFGRIVPLEFHVGSVPVAEVPNKIVGNGWLSIGDAACQANPIVGEGIRQAMYFGQQAGIIASQAIENNDISEKTLKKYENIWKEEFSKKYEIGRLIQKKISGYSDEDWDDAIQTLKVLNTEEFYSFLRSDFSKKFVFSLVAHHPRLAANSIVKLISEFL